jgi:hypothetical protein
MDNKKEKMSKYIGISTNIDIGGLLQKTYQKIRKNAS